MEILAKLKSHHFLVSAHDCKEGGWSQDFRGGVEVLPFGIPQFFGHFKAIAETREAGTRHQGWGGGYPLGSLNFLRMLKQWLERVRLELRHQGWGGSCPFGSQFSENFEAMTGRREAGTRTSRVGWGVSFGIPQFSGNVKAITGQRVGLSVPAILWNYTKRTMDRGWATLWIFNRPFYYH